MIVVRSYIVQHLGFVMTSFANNSDENDSSFFSCFFVFLLLLLLFSSSCSSSSPPSPPLLLLLFSSSSSPPPPLFIHSCSSSSSSSSSSFSFFYYHFFFLFNNPVGYLSSLSSPHHTITSLQQRVALMYWATEIIAIVYRCGTGFRSLEAAKTCGRDQQQQQQHSTCNVRRSESRRSRRTPDDIQRRHEQVRLRVEWDDIDRQV